MPWRRRLRSLDGSFSNLTLSDSADSRQPVGRLRKSLSQCAAHPDEPLADSSDSFIGTRTASRLPDETVSPVVLPAEVWHVIGLHVAPEDVSRFARICRRSYGVTLRHSFWTALYRRHTSAGVCDERQVRGCRAAVIRALHRVHRPLSRRSDCGTDTRRLIGARCCGLWHAGSPTLLCFVFRRRALSDWHHRVLPAVSEPARAHRAALFENPDAGVVALLVIAEPGGSQLAPVFGHVVQSIAVTMTTGMQQKLTVQLSQTGYLERGEAVPAGYQTRTLVISPVSNYRVVEWWHPEFHDLLHDSTDLSQSADVLPQS